MMLITGSGNVMVKMEELQLNVQLLSNQHVHQDLQQVMGNVSSGNVKLPLLQVLLLTVKGIMKK
jgi:hypothetical protein